MTIALIILATPLVFSALFFGGLLGGRAAMREAIARGLVGNTCRRCGGPLPPGPPRVPVPPRVPGPPRPVVQRDPRRPVDPSQASRRG